MDGRHDAEFRLFAQQAWRSFHAERPLWLVAGTRHHKLQALHQAVFPAVGCSAGSRYWTITELRQVRSMQTSMTRRIPGWWPRQCEDWPAYIRPEYGPPVGAPMARCTQTPKGRGLGLSMVAMGQASCPTREPTRKALVCYSHAVAKRAVQNKYYGESCGPVQASRHSALEEVSCLSENAVRATSCKDTSTKRAAQKCCGSSSRRTAPGGNHKKQGLLPACCALCRSRSCIERCGSCIATADV